jgi:hypothetical protein
VKTTSRAKITVSADGIGVVSHAGTRLLADLAAVTGLTEACSEALAGTRLRAGAGHDPGRVWTDLAVAVADGGETISDLAVLRNQKVLFGPVASTATAWRVLDAVDAGVLAGLRSARAQARQVAWAQRAETTGAAFEPSMAAVRAIDGLVLDFDASLVICHSEKEGADKTFKRTFGYHPLFCFLDNTNEALAGLLRDGNAGSNTAADHLTVTDLAIAQIPDEYRHGTPILIRADGAGATKAWLRHIRSLRASGMDVRFSVGFTLGEAVKTAVSAAPEQAWIPAIDADGDIREGAFVTEITHRLALDTDDEDGWPQGIRVIVRRERPAPGAQLSLFESHDGWRYCPFATDTPTAGGGSIQYLEARHRSHARVEDRIRCGKVTGFGRFPSRRKAINAAWLEIALTGIDLISWCQTMLIDDPRLARCEPKTLRYRLLHVAARLTRSARQTRLRIDQTWPWALTLATAFTRLAALPQLMRA